MSEIIFIHFKAFNQNFDEDSSAQFRVSLLTLDGAPAVSTQWRYSA